MGNKKAEREKKKARRRMNKIIMGIVSAVVLVAVVATVGGGYKKNVTGKGYANNNVNEIGKNGEIKTGSNGTSNENDLGIKLSNYVVAGSEEAKRSEEILKKAQEEREKEEKEEIEKSKEKSKSTKYAGKSTVQLASNTGNTRDIRSAMQEVATIDITGGTLTLSPETYEYNGQRNTPDPTLVVDGQTLILGKDYKIEYTNNKNAGIGTATATGINGYTGTISKTFTITSVPIEVEWLDEEDQYVYDGTEHIPTVKSPMDGANGDKINLKVVIKDDKQAIDAGTYTAVAEIESIEPGPVKEKPGAITVESKITTDSAGETEAVSGVANGAKLYIQITARQENGEIKSIYSDNDGVKTSGATYTLPITENGTYGFAVVGSENTSTWHTVTVNNYIEAEIEVGDYVSYTPDNSSAGSKQWRVWEIDEGTGNVVITPVNGIGSLTLSGATGNTGWLNAETAIENKCKEYINSSLEITAGNIRSMKIEDIEKVLPEEEVAQEKAAEGYGDEYTYYQGGTFYAEVAYESSETFDGYNKELTNPKSYVTLVNTLWYTGYSALWNSLGNKKSEIMNDTYGDILGDEDGWLVSRFINTQYRAWFGVRVVCSEYVGNYELYSSDGQYTKTGTFAVRPLVTLNSTLFKTGGGTSDNPWQLSK